MEALRIITSVILSIIGIILIFKSQPHYSKKVTIKGKDTGPIYGSITLIGGVLLGAGLTIGLTMIPSFDVKFFTTVYIGIAALISAMILGERAIRIANNS